MALDKISLLFGSLAAAVFGPIAKEPEFNHALFFIGNGAYYKLSADESTKKPNPRDPYTTCDEFIRTFVPDSIVSDFTRALHEKEPNIFVNTKLWNSFVHARQRAVQLFAAISITNPLEQIFIDNTTTIPTYISNQLEQQLVLAHKGINACNTTGAPRTTVWNHPLFFSIDEIENLTLFPYKKRLEIVKQRATILHPNFCSIFHLLYVFEPSEWCVYDTGLGLYYLKLKKSKAAIIATNSFNELNPQELLEKDLPEQPVAQEFLWTQQLDKIFAQKISNLRIYISGHGSNLVSHPDGNGEKFCVESADVKYCNRAQICGMPSNYFKKVLHFFNEKIKINRLVVSSCFTPAQRLQQLTQSTFNFDLITPISDYVEVKSFVPLIYTSQYVPAWLTNNNTCQLKYTVHNSGEKERTPLLSFKKFTTLLDKKLSDLPSYMRNLYDPQAQQDPMIVRPNQ